MNNSIELKQEHLDRLPRNIARPCYKRDNLKTGIVHIGVGGFHRAHQAFYTDELLTRHPEDGWAICGMGLREEDRRMQDALRKQDFLYTIMIRHPDGTLDYRVIGSIVDFILAPDSPRRALEKMADHHTKIVSLTITEGGYNFNPSTGEFMFDVPGIHWDLMHPDQPKTVFGYLAAALRIRKEKGLPAFTVLSCDNLQHNGDTTRKMMLSFTRKSDEDLSHWIETHVCFPNSMVDRITPVTTDRDVEDLYRATGMKDAWPVTCEPFIQWVIEDHFSNGRPAWEKAGAQFVQDVGPYETMKIRLLNAGHSLLGLTGTLNGYDTIDKAVKDPVLVNFLREFMDTEVTPILGRIEGIDIGRYKESLIQRFGNPNIKDKLSRICSESSAKLPRFLIPTIKEQLERGGPITCGVIILAAWCRYLELAGTTGYNYPVLDEMQAVLKESAKASATGDPLEFLRIGTVFSDLHESRRFADTYLEVIDGIRKYGIDKIIRQFTR